MRWPVISGIAAVILSSLFGCSQDSPGGSALPMQWVDAAENLAPTNHASETGSGPYKVTANTDVGHSAWIQGPRAIVTFGGRKFVVEFDKEQILLDDRPPLKLPSGTKEVAIRFAGGKLSVTADGADVPRPEATR